LSFPPEPPVSSPAPAPQAQPQTQNPGPISLTLGTANLLNLAAPGRLFYDNQEPYGAEEYGRKVAWLGAQFRRLNADLVTVQEVWDESALREAVRLSGLRYATVVAPGAEAGAIGTPRVGLVTRLPVQVLRSVSEFPPGFSVMVPEVGEHRRFERPVLHAVVTLSNGQLVHVLTAHMKSKRPKFLQDAEGRALENRDDLRVQARAALRSLIMRGAEAAAMRHLVLELLENTREPLVLMGDLNDGPHSVTSQLIAASSSIAFDRSARDTALFHAADVQTGSALRRDVGYSHIYQGWPEVLDQVWVSEEFVAGSRFQLGEVLRVEYFNDHLHEGRDRTRSDHGFVRTVFKLRPGIPH
jgi:endonuclease/exonuclease/phosphatase family metal-dependent hydrolase